MMYNAQAAVDTETMLVVGENHANDKQELKALVESVDGKIYKTKTVSAATGFSSEEAVKGVVENGVVQGPVAYCGRETEDYLPVFCPL
jgi:hypothetical protein